MNRSDTLRASRAQTVMFGLGTTAVAVGVILHLPMFLMARPMGYRLAGMPMDPGMLIGMALIVGGTIMVGAALLKPEIAVLPHGPMARPRAPRQEVPVGRLTSAHWWLILTLTLALIIDMMKPASLGFVVPGTAREYGLSRSVVAVLPFIALTGTAVGSYLWGVVADRAGRRPAILLAAIMFIGTSICGAMPAFEWNLVMCFLMGLAAGGLMPIAYTLLAEVVPTQHRGWFLVLLGGIGLVGGYLAAAGAAALLEPRFGWRIMWFLSFPTGVLLIVLNRFIPESPSFLMLHGRVADAQAIMKRFAMPVLPRPVLPQATGASHLLRSPFATITLALNVSALAWGLVNYGLLLWLPVDLRARGISVAASDALLAEAALLALPGAAVTAWLYHRWSTKGTLIVASVLTIIGLLGLPLIGPAAAIPGNTHVVLIAILMIGSGGVIAVLPPFTSESYPAAIRGRGTGLVAASSKAGGIAAQVVSMGALVPGLATAAVVLALPVGVAAVLIGRFSPETRGRRLDKLDSWAPSLFGGGPPRS